jgi:DNA-binding transcriptional MerR regulator
MLSIGEFSNVCKVSTKTLRYYAEIGLLLPQHINNENGYRYYAIEQLESMLFINRLKLYPFSLEEIKSILDTFQDEEILLAIEKKKAEMIKQLEMYSKTIEQMDTDIINLKKGKSMMSYLDTIDIRVVTVPSMYLLSVRKLVDEKEFSEAYANSFGSLFTKMQQEKISLIGPPMVLFHDQEYEPLGLDTEFAIPINNSDREFCPGLCIRTVLHGTYSQLPSVYAKQREWMDKEGYESNGPLYEVYVKDPSEISDEKELITEVFCPIKKINA